MTPKAASTPSRLPSRILRRAAVLSVLLSVAAAGAGRAITWQTMASCPFSGDPGDSISRGIYVTNYAGNNLSSVDLAYQADAAGWWSITLTARRGSFDGPLIGTPQTATASVPTSGEVHVVFDFGGAPVAPGDTITFTHSAQRLDGASSNLHYDIGNNTPACANIIETNGTTPPLSTVRRNTVGIVLTQRQVSTPCVPSPTRLCIDNHPGDRRFRATMTFQTVQSGGLSGSAQAIQLAPLGVTRGGQFWFFSQDNPELLLKVLDGCTVNGRYWVFFSAGTNVGYTLTVTDTLTGAAKTYTNADLHPAQPVQDVNALPCL